MKKVLSWLLTVLLAFTLAPVNPAAASSVYFAFEDKANMPDLKLEFDITKIEYLEDSSRPQMHIFNIFFAAPIQNSMLSDSSWVDLDLHTDGDANVDFRLTAHSVDDLSRVKNWEAAVWNEDTEIWLTNCNATFSINNNAIQFAIDYLCVKLPTEFGISAYSDYIYGDKKSFDYVPEFGDKFFVRHSFGANPQLPGKIEGSLRYATTPLPSAVPSGEDSGSFKSGNLIAVTEPIFLPDLSNRLSCSHSTVKLLRSGNKPFQKGDTIRIESAIENGATSLNSAMQNPGQKGIREVFSQNYTNTDPTLVALNVALCTSHITKIIPRYLTIVLTLSNPSRSKKETIRTFMQVLQTSPVSEAVENARNFCALGAFETSVLPLFSNNLLIEQPATPGNAGGSTTINGTLFRQGLLATNEKIVFYADKNGQPSQLIGSTNTDEQGQFSFAFNLFRNGQAKTTRIYAYVSERTAPFGKLNVAFLAFTFPLDFDWAQDGSYVKSLSFDWIPSPIPACIKALEKLKLTSGDDDRHPIAWYVASKVLFGSKDKKQYVSINDKISKELMSIPPKELSPIPPATSRNPSASVPRYNSGYSYSGGGTRCTSVSGYWRKGSYVRGYIRCR